MRELSLFSGAGGGLLGSLLLGWRPVGYVEYNEYCQRVIRQRIDDGILPDAPIFGDVRAFLGEGYAAAYQGLVDVVTAGWPCQPHSSAGKRLGTADEREGWPYVIETIRQVRPRWFLGENVRGILSTGAGRYFANIQRDLAQSGYDCRWRILSAAELGAPHKRDRLWLCAYAQNSGTWGLSERQGRQGQATTDADRMGQNVADSHSQRQQEQWCGISNESQQSAIERDSENVADTDRGCGERAQDEVCPGRDIAELGGEDVPNTEHNGDGWGQQLTQDGQGQRNLYHSSWWDAEPPLGRMVDGYAGRVAELQAAGNAQVASVVRAAWHLLAEGLTHD